MVSSSLPKRPSIIQITCHDLGRHLNCYGATTVRSPHLDALAASGVMFTQAFLYVARVQPQSIIDCHRTLPTCERRDGTRS